MRSKALLLLLATAAGLAMLVGLEASDRPDSPELATNPAPPAVPAAPSATVAAASPSHREQWMETILARPLFNTGRRPLSQLAAAAVAVVAAPLPRLAGVVVSGTDRSAILVPADGSKPVVVREGGQVGGLVVKQIQAGLVTLGGPDGVTTLRLTYDPHRPAAPAEPANTGLPRPPAFPLYPGLPLPLGSSQSQ